MKKKVLVVAGAGASLDLGMPSVNDIDLLCANWAQDGFALFNDPNENLYTYVRNRITKYYHTPPVISPRKQVNFEKVFYTLLQLASIKDDPLKENPLNAFCNLDGFPDINFFGSTCSPAGYDFRFMVYRLIDKLLDEFGMRCNRVQITRNREFGIFKQFLSSLRNDFNIGVITLNYDNLFKQAMPDLSTGFDESSKRFMPEWVYGAVDWNFCYHVHGSVHFDQIGGNYGDMHGIGWRPNLDTKFNQNSLGRNGQNTVEGLSFPTSVIVAGYGKSNQIHRNPFRTYYSQIGRFVLEADAFLFVGYGFADLHLNRFLEGIRNDRNRPVIIIDWAEDNQDPMPFRNDDWSRNLGSAIPFDGSKMSYRNHTSSAPISELKSQKEFEVSNDPDYPLAIWYGGFLEACQNYNKLEQILH